MRKIRQRHGFAWLALFALTVQIVLSLGHAHHRHGGNASLVATSECATGKASHCDPALPAKDDDTCSICWAMSIAGSTITPVFADLVVSALPKEMWVQPAIVAFEMRDRSSPFRARGPPIPCFV